MNDFDGALHAYDQALRHNFQSIQALNAISSIHRTKENFPKAIDYLQIILKLDGNNGEVWGSLGTGILLGPRAVVVLNAMNRALLLDDGGAAASVFGISTSSVSSPRSQGG